MRKDLFQMAAQDSIDQIEEYIESIKDKTKNLTGSAKQDFILLIDNLEADRDKLIACYNELSNATEETFQTTVETFKTLSYELQKRVNAIFN